MNKITEYQIAPQLNIKKDFELDFEVKKGHKYIHRLYGWNVS